MGDQGVAREVGPLRRILYWFSRQNLLIGLLLLFGWGYYKIGPPLSEAYYRELLLEHEGELRTLVGMVQEDVRRYSGWECCSVRLNSAGQVKTGWLSDGLPYERIREYARRLPEAAVDEVWSRPRIYPGVSFRFDCPQIWCSHLLYSPRPLVDCRKEIEEMTGVWEVLTCSELKRGWYLYMVSL